MANPKASFLQHLYQQLRNAAMDWCKNEITDEHCVFNVDADRGDNFWVQLVRPANVKSADFRESSRRFMKKLEEDGLINDLLPVKLTITQTGTALDIEGEARKIGESREDFIQAYRHKVIDAVNNDPNWDMRYYPRHNDASTELKINLMYQTAIHHKKIVKNLTKIINDICGPVDPVQASIDVKGPIATVKFWMPKLNEAKGELLSKLVYELVRGFQYAEEEYYQDQSKKPPYTLKVLQNGDKVALDMEVDSFAGGAGDVGAARVRLGDYIDEFFDEHIIKPRVEKMRKIGLLTFNFYLDGLKEAKDNPYDFAEKVAYGLMKKFQAELTQKGAHNTAKFEVTRVNNGVPCIIANLANRSGLTRAAVERAIRDVVAAELPPDNILKLQARFGGMGTASNGSRIAVAIAPA